MVDMVREVAHRRAVAGDSSAGTLVDEMQAALHAIAEAPASGSRRIGQLLGVPDLQWKRVGKTRLWFWYREEATHIDVVRLVSTDRLPRLAMLPDDLH